MKLKAIGMTSLLGVAMSVACGGQAHAQDAAATAGNGAAISPLRNGPYVAPLAYYFHSNDNALHSAASGAFMFGIRRDFYAMEFGGMYTDTSGAVQDGVKIRGLLFPVERWVPGLYAVAGFGVLQYNHFPNDGDVRIHTYTAEAGAGYLLPLHVGRYDFAIRAEAVYRNGRRERQLNGSDTDLSIPTTFNDELVGVGLQLPLGARPRQAEVQEPPVAVVPVEQAPPPPPPPPSPPPCVTPEAGQAISLQGCKSGDKIILHGVNFDFNKATLTVNAKAILDQVAAELKKYPAIDVELGGYTDGKGGDAYNLRLSDRRAASVKAYLVQAGVEAKRMSSKGYGKADPVADNSTDEGRELNRRVELKITSSDVSSSSTGTTDAGTATTAVVTGADSSPPANSASPAEGAAQTTAAPPASSTEDAGPATPAASTEAAPAPDSTGSPTPP